MGRCCSIVRCWPLSRPGGPAVDGKLPRYGQAAGLWWREDVEVRSGGGTGCSGEHGNVMDGYVDTRTDEAEDIDEPARGDALWSRVS